MNNNHQSASFTPVVSPLDIALAVSPALHAAHLSMNQGPFSPFNPYSPLVAASPSVAFSNLSLRTPHRTIPAALPPTPKLTGASPKISTPSHAFATPDLPSAPLPGPSSTNPKNLSSLRSNYKKMRRESNANRKTEMLPPSEIPAPSPGQTMVPMMMEEWVDFGFGLFSDEVGNGTPPVVDSNSPSVGPAPLPLTTPVPEVDEQTWDVFKMIETPTTATLPSPTIQQPLDSSTPFSSGNTSAFQHSPAVSMPDDFSAFTYIHNAVAGPSGSPNYSDILSSPTHVPSVNPSPRVAPWQELTQEFPLFSSDAASPPVHQKPFTPISSGAPNLSQESVNSSASANSLSVPRPRAPSMSPSMAKRPRLSFDGTAHRRNLSSSSSAAPSPRIGVSASGPTGYRKHMQAGDLTPLNAPTQKRNYAIPSATSRKEFPPSVTKALLTTPSPRGSKRSSDAADLPSRDDVEQEERGGTSPSSGSESPNSKEHLLAGIEAKRRANTIAARKSRQRKLEFLNTLQLDVQALQTENSELRERLATAEQRAQIAEQRAENAERELLHIRGLTPASF